MKFTSLIITLFFLVIHSNAQIKYITKVISFDPESIYTKLYEFKTEKKLSKTDFELINKNNGQTRFFPYFDKYGKIEKFYYIPYPIPEKYQYLFSLNKKPESGTLFPDFVFNTIDDKQIQLNDLKGKYVVISFGFISNNQWLNIHEISMIQTRIQLSDKPDKIVQIVLFNDSKENILSSLIMDTSNMIIVPNGEVFIQKWNINKQPTIIIIDKEGKLIKNYHTNNLDYIELLKLTTTKNGYN